MSEREAAFGDAVGRIAGIQYELTSPLPPEEDRADVRRRLAELTPHSGASLRMYGPRPTAAFAPRDTTHAAYGSVVDHLRHLGFAAIERGAGGLLAVYDETALIIDLVSPHPQPRDHTRERFRLFAGFVAGALATLGLDARIGALPGEYCPGDYSVNARGLVKLAGLAQRVVKHGYHMGAVLSVSPSPAAKTAVTDAYRMFGLDFEPSTFGCAAELLPHLSDRSIRDGLAREIALALGLAAEIVARDISPAAP